ncbi:hypothetical protein [Mycobacterium xenopi]|uniref:hypothetical protein n=1 Tax=Mycobacterium xenopi TaxID=1789 RepID=UPI00187272C7|nr:hypothetical protein [Mycobacterium xenopi]
MFEVEPDGPGQTRVRSATWAAFPGMHGQVYRALVIGTGTHRVVVRRILRRIARRAQVDADYVDVLEVPISPDDARTAEQAFHDALGHAPRRLGRLASWIHQHVLRLRLAVSSASVVGACHRLGG